MLESIFSKLMMRFVVVILVTLIALGIFLTYLFEDYYFSNKEEEFIKQGQKIAKLVERSFYEDNYAETVEDLRTISTFLDTQIWITDAQGLIVATFNCRESWIGAQLDEEGIEKVYQGSILTNRGEDPNFDQPVLSVAVPIVIEEQIIGAIFVYSPIAGIASLVGRLQDLLFFAALMSIVLAVILSFSFAKSLLNPLNQLNQAALKLADGDLDTRIDMQGNDEVNQLGRSFNYLASRLETTIDKLNQEKTKLESILVGMNEGVVAIDQKQEIILINPQAKGLIEFEGPGLGKKLENLIDDENLISIFVKALEKEELIIDEFSLTNRAQVVRILIHITPIYTQDNLLGVVGVMQDISERWELEQLQKEFVANVSHELKSPLTSIQGFVKAIRDGVLLDESSTEEYLDIILDEVQRLTRLVNDLLDLSQLERKAIAMEFEKNDLKEVIEQVVFNLQPQFKDKDLTVIQKIPDTNLKTWIDRDRIEQVLFNLLSNAIKFTPVGKEIKIKVEDLTTEFKVQIEDQGPGIPQEELDYIWNRFYKVDKARTRDDSASTGLGLAIVKEIIDRHQGQVKVNSEIGVGTEFIFTLPKKREKLNF
ncbi:HAMP domain-containing sensor histidine kinase [Fuchsiella alkaliacetigena]|uniref:HAMP domain-containing sensor histidine kinase n=1 Tax=Fuchsiella alkaliacetigena TaxID=957042 RepID=UPI00200A52F5|nr:ATP-binding protein [Fuchsiella alkaliacetigena]MCK8825022.1 cell wall metabolism sensor histidine kinase WalK [Fuchsiella alkaliacetigena]